MGEYANNHIATASYLKGWADPKSRQVGRVLLEDPLGQSELKKPEKVGYRRNFFGDDAEVRREAERRFNSFESKGIEALKRLGSSWPPENQDRVDIGCLVGIHMVRNPAFLSTTAEMSEAEIDRKMASYRETMSEGQIAEMLAYLRSTAFKIEHMLDLVLKHASLLASMHWALIEFPEPLLATSDQPVSVVPLLEPGTTAGVQASPQTGFMETEEIRFPVDPWRALLMSWIVGFDTERALRAPYDISAELNRTTIAQADREWIHFPARRPTRLKPGDLGDQFCRPVVNQLDRHYTTGYARNSPRRTQATKLLNKMIEEEVTGEVRWSRVVLKPDRSRLGLRGGGRSCSRLSSDEITVLGDSLAL